MLHKALSASDDVEMHHEYMVHIVQPLAVRRYMGSHRRRAMPSVLSQKPTPPPSAIAKSAIGAIPRTSFPGLFPELAELFPDAEFVHLVRDGRKVASSYFHKLGDECYDDRSTKLFRAYADDPFAYFAAASGKKILVAATRHGNAVRGGIPSLRPIPTHRLALVRNQSRHSGVARAA